MRNVRLRCLVFAVTAAGLAAPALAEGPYAEAYVGASNPHDAPEGSTTELDEGNAASLSAGRAFASGWRPALEYARWSNDIQVGSAHFGEAEVNAAMANLWYDVRLEMAPRVRPYVGGGVGVADVSYHDALGAQAEGSDAMLAYQGGAGLAFDLTRRLAMSVGYRYFETDEGGFLPGGGTDRYRAESGIFGVRYTFGDAPAPVAAATPPAPAPQVEVAAFETIVLRPVNFQFDRSELTGPAQATLDELAARLVAHPGLGVVIEGHTDSIGSEEYNRGLGQRRANAVREYLVARGVRADALQVVSRGESEPVADNGTPEGRAQNRRAEFSAEQHPENVKIVIEGPSEASVDAAGQ